jgi:hypothetical protein
MILTNLEILPQFSKCAQKFKKNKGLTLPIDKVSNILKKFSKIWTYAPIFKMCPIFFEKCKTIVPYAPFSKYGQKIN